MTKLSPPVPQACIFTFTLAAALAGACADVPEDGASVRVAAEAVHAAQGVAPLPCFDATPNIAAAAATRLPGGSRVRAVFSTASGAQVYRCERNAQGVPVWVLRTPLAQLVPSKGTRQKLGAPALAYHFRSDFGGLTSPVELAALGLVDATGTAVTAPVWALTFATEGSPQLVEERETVAGRVVAQDVVGAGNIPHLLLEVRGRSVAGLADGIVLGATSSAGPTLDPFASSDYVLRWNLRGGVAPAASSCTDAAVGTESLQAYAADYYFVDTP